MSAPTEKQYDKLRMLGSGAAWVVGGRREPTVTAMIGSRAVGPGEEAAQ